MDDVNVTVLRLGHRPGRDQRMTTHIALVARALGAKCVVVSESDPRLEQAIVDVGTKFGGDFSVQTETNWKGFVRQWKGPVVHLTMYGEPIEKVIDRIPRDDILVIVGAEKVPPEAYELADFNISVTNQPHSEVAALAIFLDRMTGASWTRQSFEGRMRIVPYGSGKIVVDRGRGYLSDEDCQRILESVGIEEEIAKHAKIVAKIAAKIARECGADVELVRTAAMLHDIGRTETHGPRHGFEGAEILRGLGLPEDMVLIVERHVGGGLDEEDAADLGLPKRDMTPVTLEEKIVCIADKLVEDNNKVPINNEIQKLKEKGLDKAARKVKTLYDEIEKTCGISLDEIEI